MDYYKNDASSKKAEMIVSPWLCLACGACISSCPTGAVFITDAADIDPKLCIGCGSCAGRCPTGAISVASPF